MLKILFFDPEEGCHYAYNPPTLLDDQSVALEQVDEEGEPLHDGKTFFLGEVREALDGISDLVEACHDS